MRETSLTNNSAAEAKRRSIVGSVGSTNAFPGPYRPLELDFSSDALNKSASSRGATPKEKLHDGEKSKALRLDPADASHSGSVDVPATTGNPFIRAPIRTDAGSSTRSRSASVRPANCKLDSYDWGDDPKSVDLTPTAEASRSRPTSSSKDAELVAKVPVGVSRLHEVVVPELK